MGCWRWKGRLDRQVHLRCLYHLVGSEAPRADADPTHAAVNQGADALQIGLEPAGPHVVSVADHAANHRLLSTDFTTLRHTGHSSVWGDTKHPGKRPSIPDGPDLGISQNVARTADAVSSSKAAQAAAEEWGADGPEAQVNEPW